MKQFNRYFKFIEWCDSQDFIDDYLETHHIVPKSWGGLDEKDNLIRLPARHHFIAHLLLYKAHPCKTFGNAVHAFQMYKGCRFLTSKEIAIAREIKSKIQTGVKRPEHSKRMSGKNNPNYGVTISQERRNKGSKSLKTFYKTEAGLELKTKLSYKHKGKTISKEHRQKLSEAHSGLNNSSCNHDQIHLFNTITEESIFSYVSYVNLNCFMLIGVTSQTLFKLRNGKQKVTRKGWTVVSYKKG